jgi:hypothetical protein
LHQTQDPRNFANPAASTRRIAATTAKLRGS